MATVQACGYQETGSTDTLATYYGQDAEHLRMMDFLVHEGSHFDIGASLALAVGDLENGGPGNNWLQLGSTAQSDFQAIWAANNGTGHPTPTAAQISAIDSLNAAAGIYFLSLQDSCGYTNWQGILSKFSAYNGICGGCSCPYTTAYAWSALFLAHGDAYEITDYGYAGAYYASSPTGTQPAYRGCGSPATLEVPGFGIVGILRGTPIGRNSNGKQIVLLANSTVDAISALQIDVNLYSSPYDQPVSTGDHDFAARSTQDKTVCPIAVGAAAASALEASCSRLGLSCTSFATFAGWEASSDHGFINATGANRTDSDNMGNTAAYAASEAGW